MSQHIAMVITVSASLTSSRVFAALPGQCARAYWVVDAYQLSSDGPRMAMDEVGALGQARADGPHRLRTELAGRVRVALARTSDQTLHQAARGFKVG